MTDQSKASAILAIYGRRRNLITRSAMFLILYVIFNSSSSSSSSPKRDRGSQKRSLATEIKSSNPLFRLWQRLKRSPTLILLRQLDTRNHLRVAKYLAAQLLLLLAKAFITLKVASLDGKLVSSMVSKQFRRFFKYFALWIAIGVPASIVSSFVSRTQSLLAESVRSGLTNSLLHDYLPDSGNPTIYQLLGTGKGEDPNHLLTTVVERFSNAFSILPGQLCDPILDILLAFNQLSKVSDYAAEGTLLLGLVANFSTLLLKVFTPNFAALSAKRTALESKFHAAHAKVIEHKEEIALSRGHRKELDVLDTAYFESERFQKHELRRLAVYNFAIGFIFKYGLGAFGLMLCAAPVFTTAYLANFHLNKRVVSQLSADFFANRRLLLSASDSLGRLIQSKKTMQSMNGYSGSICSFQSELQDINKSTKHNAGGDKLLVGPNVSYGNEITFQNVPLETPGGTLLAENVSFSIRPGENLLIIGPNGCGKSSLFRVLGGLWEVKSPGHIVVPESHKEVFYLPQCSYFTYGSLRQQIIYPDSTEDYERNSSRNDEFLRGLLGLVDLGHLLSPSYQHSNSGSGSESSASERSADLDVVDKWSEVLSTGEQQRLAMARLYYHQPTFAVLDECTSAISPDLEKKCYRIATEQFKITVLSVCHRVALWKFHTHILKFHRRAEDQPTQVIFTRFNARRRLQRHNELLDIESKLKGREELTERLEVLKRQCLRRNRKLMYIDD